MEWSFLLNALLGMTAIINPVGNVPVFLEYVDGESVKVKKAAAILMAVAVFVSLVFFFLFGRTALNLFGITIPAFRIAGGILIFSIGLRLMNGRTKFDTSGLEASAHKSVFRAASNRLSKIIVPVVIPMYVGPGTITTVMLYADAQITPLTYYSVIGVLALVAVIIGICLYFSNYLQKALGANGMQIIIRLFGMALVAIAVQFVIDGVNQLLPGVLNPEFVHNVTASIK